MIFRCCHLIASWNVLEQWVTDGYVYSLNEVSFGYMCFIDPEKKGRSLCFCLFGLQKAGHGRTFLCHLI